MFDERQGTGQRLLIGRDRELAELLDMLAVAEAGRGGLALVVGEPGIGKTHLVDAFAAAAGDRGAAVVWGRSWEAGGAPAYWPWIEVLRDLLPAGGDPEPGTAAIAQLLPELRDRLAGAALPQLEPAQERFRLFDAIAAFLRRRAQDRPLVVILDDLHAADLPTIALLQFAARGLRRARIVLVGTYRDTEARLTPEIAQALAGVAREGRYLALGRLDPEQVASWVRACDDGDAELARTLHQRTEGNPLFIVETLRLLRQRRRAGTTVPPIPDGVREVIGQRLQGLPAEVRALLDVASVLGRQVDLALLGAVTGSPAGVVRERLAPAVAADVLDADDERPSFSHILLREVLHAGLPAGRRAELHAAVADALLPLAEAPDAPLAELVHHLFAAVPARDVDLAVTWARRAAQRALRQLAFEDAVALYERAAAALPAGRSADRCDLLLELARARIVAGRGASGQRICLEAAELARRLPDAERLARAALGYGEQFTFARVDPRLIGLLQEALAGLPPDDSRLRARLLGRLAAAMQPADDARVPMDIARQAIAMSGRLADERTRLAVLQSGTSALLYFADPAERIPLNEELTELAGRLGDTVRELRGRMRLCFDYLEHGDAARADACIEAYERLAREVGHPTYLWPAPLVRAMRAMMQGRFADAEALAEEARAIADRTEDPNRDLSLTLNRVGLLRAAARDQELAAFAADAAAVLGRQLDRWFDAPCIAAVHARTGDLDRARAALQRLPGGVEGGGSRMSLVWVAEVASALDDAALAASVGPLLAPLGGRNHCWGMGSMVCEGPIARGLGLAAATCGRIDEAARHFEAALERVDRLGAPPHRARIELEYAAALLRRGTAADRERAARLVDAARATAERLDMPGLLALAGALAGGAPVAARPALVPAAPPFELRCDGEVWTVRCEGSEFHLKDSRGLQILARLVAAPEQEFHVTDLLAPPGERGHVEDAGEQLDREAIASYRDRLAELRDELAQAEDWADQGRAERLREEIEALTAELSRGVGLGGRPRRASATSEKARINVRRRLLDAIERIGEHSRPLADHLTWAVKTGNFCGYHPAGRRGTK